VSFTPGDAVECISTESPCCGEKTLRAPGLPQPKLRGTYRVAQVGVGECQACGAELACFVPTGCEDSDWSWPEVIFRKIEPSSENIFRMAKVTV